MSEELEEADAPPARADPPGPPEKTREEKDIAAVGSLRTARLAYVAANHVTAQARVALAAAIQTEAQTLETLKAARLSMKLEAGDE